MRVVLTAVKKPVVYTKVAVRNWEPFVRAGVHDVYAPHMFFNRIKLNYPVSIGDYRFQMDPSKSTHIQLSWCPLPPEGDYATEKERVKAGRAVLMGLTFEDFERLCHAQGARVEERLAVDRDHRHGIASRIWPNLLGEIGFAPEQDRCKAGRVRLTRCPLLDAAREHPEVVCAVHLGLVRGALDNLGRDPAGTELIPFAEPEHVPASEDN